jgi:hypothetical protein
MGTKLAAAILRTLAEGFDPHSGEELPEGGPLSNVEVVRALLAGARALDEALDAPARGRALPEAAGQPWTPEEDARLIREFDAGNTGIAELSSLHERSRGAIFARLRRLGREPVAARRADAGEPPLPDAGSKTLA